MHVTKMLEEQFSVIKATSTDFYLSSWYKKFISKSDVFQSEFDIVKKLNIVQDISCRVTLLPLVDDILIINAETRCVICKYGWFANADKYSDSYTPLNLSALKENLKSQDLFMPVKPMSDAYQVVSYPDFNPGSSCRIAILMKNDTLVDYLKSLEFNTFTDFRIYWEKEPDNTVTLPGSLIAATSIISPSLFIHFQYPTFRQTYGVEMTLYAVSLFFLSVVVSLLLSGIFCFLFSHPLQKLVNNLHLSDRTTHRDAYRNISEHIESMHYQNNLMEEENSRLRSETIGMMGTMRADLMLHAMKGEPIQPDFGYFDQLFPMLVNRTPYYLVILSKPSLLLEERTQNHYLYLNIFDGYCGYLIWTELPEHARSSLMELLREETMIGCSQEYCGFENLSACYRDALEQASYWKTPVRLTDAIALLDHIRQGECNACLDILEKYKQQISSAVACKWIFELLQTYFFTDTACSYVCSWESIEEMLRACCDNTAENTNKQSSGSVIVTVMSNMIRDHCEIPDLSLKYFSNQFDISISSLSKLFSQIRGENFSTALQNARISRAKDMLLQASDMSISDIGTACGYENYLSFKRAFTRCEGISPREYRDIHRH